ncbi:SAM-dependent methyltransferase [Streptomyces sp. NPDC087270]|uniref:SAM-dependent methyltransferase n=1 Tax=Streptomyces sp. NPDC087270 TaxID=3365774 RepID=UPI0037FBD48E
MTATLYRGSRPGTRGRARDWAEIQERMLVPLYETVYDRLEVGAGTRLLGLGCGSGLALMLASARGAAVIGHDRDAERLALARERLAARERDRPPEHRTRLLAGDLRLADLRTADPRTDRPRGTAALAARTPALSGAASAGNGRTPPPAPDAPSGAGEPAADRSGSWPGRGYDVVTAFEPAAPAAELGPALAAVARTARRGSTVVLAGWGPPERCATSHVLKVATRLAEPRGAAAPALRLSGRDDLEDLARTAGLRPDGSGRVSCPFGYPDLPSAVRGLLSTGLFDAAVAATDHQQVDKELAEALHPYRRPDGSVRMENVFRYLIART